MSDLTIIGAGPAGLQAAIFGASEGLTVKVIAPVVGGQAGTSTRIENLLGFPVGISGADLMDRAHMQAVRLGVEFVQARVTEVSNYHGLEVAYWQHGRECVDMTRTVVVASGLDWRTLDVNGADTSPILHYGSNVTQFKKYAGKHVVVVGGANSAGQAAMGLSKYAKTVRIVSRSPLSKSMSQYLIEQLQGTKNVQIKEGEQVTHYGTNSVIINGTKEVKTDGAFAFIGAEPRTTFIDVVKDSKGFIVTADDFSTSMSGVFAIGDVRVGSLKRVAGAMGDGANVVSHVHKYLGGL